MAPEPGKPNPLMTNMDIMSFLIGWIFRQDFEQELQKIKHQQEEEMRIRQEAEDSQTWNELIQDWAEQDDNC